MIYIYGILVAVQIVIGQVLWKLGAEKTQFVLTKDYIFSPDIFKFIFSPYIIIGIIFYGVATVLYMSLLAKFEYTSLQAVVVTSSLISTFIMANLVFNEKANLINLLGLAFMIGGVLLVTKF